MEMYEIWHCMKILFMYDISLFYVDKFQLDYILTYYTISDILISYNILYFNYNTTQLFFDMWSSIPCSM